MYRLLISGSRKWDLPVTLKMLIHNVWTVYPELTIVHGDCPQGADAMAREFAEEYGIPEERYPADWKTYGKAAGYIRNKQMVDTKPDYAIFFIRGESRGTKNCLELAREAGIPHVIFGDRP